jgi:hypothetical protein
VLLLQAPGQLGTPIIVNVIDAPGQTLGDVVLSAVGISGVMAFGAAVLGVVLGVCFIAFRIRQRRRQPTDSPSDHQQLRLHV